MSESTGDVPEIVKVARDLREIETLSEALEDQAVHHADDPELPGGDAMVYMAPVANPEAWENRYEAAEEHGRPVDHVEDEDDSYEPPLLTLVFWTGQWRWRRDAESDLRPTIASEVAFLRDSLDWAYQESDDWANFVDDIRRARVRLENTLYAGDRAERTRVTCIEPECGDREKGPPRLIKAYGRVAAEDHYKCPVCKRKYTQDEFIRAKHHMLASEGAARFVAKQMVMQWIDRPRRTVQQWLDDCRARSYCDVVTRQVMVWYPDIRELDLSTQRRQRRKVAA